MVLGGAFYGYVVASITSMIASNDLNATAYYDRMDHLVCLHGSTHSHPSFQSTRVDVPLVPGSAPFMPIVGVVGHGRCPICAVDGPFVSYHCSSRPCRSG